MQSKQSKDMWIEFFLISCLLLLLLILFQIHKLERSVSQGSFRPISFFREPQLLELVHMINRLNSTHGDISLQVHCEVKKHNVIYYLSFYNSSVTEISDDNLLQKITWVRYSDYVEIKKTLHALIVKEEKSDYVTAFKHLSHLKR